MALVFSRSPLHGVSAQQNVKLRWSSGSRATLGSGQTDPPASYPTKCRYSEVIHPLFRREQ